MKNFSRIGFLVLLVAALVGAARSQEMTKEDWQKQITESTAKRNDLKNKLTGLQTEVAGLQKQDADKAAALKQCQDDLAALIGPQEGPFNALLDKIDARLNELARLSNQDLWARRAELDSVQNWINAARKEPLSALAKYGNRLNDDQSRLDALRKQVQQIAESGQGMQTYTVGTWARDRDCLWNIAKKPKIYDNAFLWPKIWQGNRDQIKNPDIIHTGQKLKIPPKAELTREERAAVRSYWSKRQSRPSASN